MNIVDVSLTVLVSNNYNRATADLWEFLL